MNESGSILAGWYDLRLVALSIAIAICASYTALDLVSRIVAATGAARRIWLGGGAVVMGLGIWSMHYIGMLAFDLSIAVQYDWPTVLASLLAAILASGVALHVVSQPRMGLMNAAVGSLFMGLGIAGMHFIGMEAMRVAAIFRYSLPMVSLSVFLAVAISFVGLWLLFDARKESDLFFLRKIASALAMGAAIPVMHYTGMAACTFVPSQIVPDLSNAVSVSTLGIMAITMVTLLLLGLAVLGSILDRRYSARTRELAAADKRYRLLFERSLAGVLRVGLDGRILDCNEASARIFGFATREEFLATHIDQRYEHPAQRQSFLAQIEAEQCVSNFEYQLLRKDRSRAWLLANSTLVTNVEGVPTAIESTLIDITERKRTEEALAASETKFRGILESAPDAIVISNMRGRIVLVNAETERLFGYQRDEIIGQAIENLLPERLRETHPQQQEDSQEPLRRLIGSGADLSGLRKDRSEFPIEISLATIETSEGTLISSAVRDISARKRTEEELKTAKEAAEMASRAKSEFLANMSHEIRTPMNGIIGMTELALDTNLTDEQREYLSMVKLSANSLLTVINDILDFSKIEAGKMDLDISEFSIREVLEETNRSLSIAVGEKRLELVSDIHSDIPELVCGDPIRLRQVLVNLIGNAIKFTDRGEIVLQAEVQLIKDDHAELHFIVRDTGIGISKDKQELIFEAFAQADSSSSRKHGGTGLGLTISSQLVAMMGGRIWLESELGQGSTFHFTARFALPQDPGQSSPKRDPQPNLAGVRVLVVDDNPTNRRIFERTLLQWGMKPTVVASGWAALAELRRAQRDGQPISLVLLDAQMPQLDGFGTAVKIKHDPDLTAATIMMLTSGGQRGDADRCREVGISAYLTKPVRQAELRQAILRILGLHPPQNESSALVTRYSLQESSKSFRILLAEDNAINRELVVRVLAKRGHSVTVAPNGKFAVDALESQSFDVVLMDVQMPEMDGFEATAAIRRKEAARGGHIPIIALTAHALKGDRERCTAAGMDDYIAKPIQTDELLQLIESVTERFDVSGTVETEEGTVLDWNLALERVDGDEELLNDLIRIFCEEYPKMLGAVQKAVAENKPDHLERAAHTLKGAVGALGAQEAFDAALVLERLARARELNEAGEACASLVQKIERLKAALENPAAQRRRVPALESA